MIFKKNISIVYLQGGIGNLLFQISAALKFSKNDFNNIYVVDGMFELGRSKKIKQYLNLDLRELSLLQKILFGIDIQVKNYFIRSFIKILKKLNIHFGTHFHGGFFDNFSSETNLNLNKKYILTGYYQHPDFYKDSKNKVIEMFIKKNGISLSSKKDQIVFHLRRTDYISLKWDLPISYYINAIKLISKNDKFKFKKIRIIADDPFAIFSIKFYAEKYGLDVLESYKVRSDLEDFIEIASSSVIVMSNSTFCWWAASIGDFVLKDIDVFYPKGWIRGFNDCLKEPHWKAIEFEEEKKYDKTLFSKKVPGLYTE
tara:strand:- start:145 stop:1083 length:939 start_codon:yes stop_codon:yes gene_type:complete